ncbi:MAG: DUF1844 domain-containing protein [Armatimonadota bacterium]|nr:DUF1844 domain-containing protein [Armatimonadota bacterium]MDW8105253.1 DUF1844 domain-containing protein [Armatimonadota bacterium]MDW8289368.1 DUF1844 domain-containing protein [Armatimonadota bacterium]
MEQQSSFEQTAGQEQQAPKEPVDVVAVVLWVIGELQAQAWIKMGLWKDPVTDELVTDLPQAKIAIDSVAALVEVVRPHLSDEQRREMERLLTDLRLNFVQRSGTG